MKSKCSITGWLALGALATFNLQLATCFAQGTAFTYQGRLNNNSAPANGSYDFRFRLSLDPFGNNLVDGPVLINGLAVNNGLFLATLDFGSVFAGSTYWQEVDVKTNGAGGYTALFPLQVLTPAPYALMANNASNLLGTLLPAQLSAGTANINIIGSAATATTANNFSGSLSGDVTGTQSATAVAKVGGQTAANVASGANAANAATSDATGSTIVKRDGSGSFTNNSITLNGNLNLPATTASTGIIYLDGSPFVHGYGIGNFFAGTGAGNLTTSGSANTGVGDNALHSDTNGIYNTAIGLGALGFSTGSSENTAVGAFAISSIHSVINKCAC